MISKSVAIAGGLGLAFVGYCVYFDHKRRSHPDYRKRVIERRKKALAEQAEKEFSNFPDLTDEKAVHNFFVSEISRGEQLLGLGDIENSVVHLANAVAVTAHKENLLNMFRSTLPDPVFSMLVQKLPEVSRKIYNLHKQRTGGAGGASESSDILSSRNMIEENKIIDITESNLAVDDLLD